MLLHGKYVNGKITVTEVNAPQIESDAIVRLVPKVGKGDGVLSLAGIWADREDMKDSVWWVNEQRKKRKPY